MKHPKPSAKSDIMPPPAIPPANGGEMRRTTRILGLSLLAAAVATAVIWWQFGNKSAPSSVALLPELHAYSLPDERAVFATYAGSESCRECHPQAWQEWRHSHHGLAERSPNRELDQAAFDPPKSFPHGKQSTDAATAPDGGYQLTTTGFGGERKPYRLERVIGHQPLRQFLVAGTGGRYHATEAAWDPQMAEWFNVFGQEDRQPGEWGHWTGRGMVWNQMCATCHNTRLRKNYDAATDSYRTAMAEATVSCEACHGPAKAHAEWQREHQALAGKEKGTDPTLKRFTRDQMTENCAGCHARRGELTGDFVPGESFWNHYQLTIVDHTDTYHPDGQVRDENYEFGSFVSSRMFHAGVRCADCHAPHTAKTILSGNDLCMRCHTGGGGFPTAPIIAPEAHSFHRPHSTGNQCINCHMPQTTYMQRHPRHDHGFTIPDPLLTKQHGTPNACNRCHTDKDADWSLAAAEKWWGPKMERRTRQRAQNVAKARQGREEARSALLALLQTDEIPYWKASATLLLERWMSDPTVAEIVQAQARHEHPLVRAAAAQAMQITASQPNVRSALQQLLGDPSRVVRNTAAWALRDSLDLDSPTGRDLLHYLSWNADQPSGQMQLGQFNFARGKLSDAISHLETAVRWDANSPPFHHDLAVMYATNGDSAKALASLQRAVALAPTEPAYHYQLALALSEVGQSDSAIASLQEAVHLDPSMSRAWYNLGLALNAKGNVEEGLEALKRGEAADPADGAIPYARATILAQLNRREEARTAASRALEINPNSREAAELMLILSRQ